jgi:hypothetical protein
LAADYSNKNLDLQLDLIWQVFLALLSVCLSFFSKWQSRIRKKIPSPSSPGPEVLILSGLVSFAVMWFPEKLLQGHDCWLSDHVLSSVRI